MSKLDSKLEQVKGSVKEVVGKASENHELETEGTVEKISGKIKEGIETVKETVEEIVDKIKK